MKNTLQNTILISAALCGTVLQSQAQCASESNIYSFDHNGKTYEVVKENKTWVDAAACAVERGGTLAIIDDSTEQAIINDELANNAGISASNTTAPDGGGGAYVWLGGNDLATEGTWVWDGNGDSTGTAFWMGDASGSAQNGAFTNWGNEPDNFNNQDALGLSLDGWPLGSTGQWNDVDHTNTLYFIIEKPEETTTGSNEITPSDVDIKVFPNPTDNLLNISGSYITSVKLLSINGQELLTKRINSQNTAQISLTNIPSGIYLLKVANSTGQIYTERFEKQ